MVSPALIILPCLVGGMTVATIGAPGSPLYLRYRPRDWRVSQGIVCLSAALSAGAYHMVRRIPPGGTG